MKVGIASEATGLGKKTCFFVGRWKGIVRQRTDALNGEIRGVYHFIEIRPITGNRAGVCLCIAHIDHNCVVVPQPGHTMEGGVQLTSEIRRLGINAVDTVDAVDRALIVGNRIFDCVGVLRQLRQEVIA